MIPLNNRNGGDDELSAGAYSAANAISGASTNAAREVGRLAGVFGVIVGALIYKWDFVFVGYWRRRIAHLYDRLGCKFLG